ncbi:hypothetical protein POM88_051343 [Heracleum sosnowskyi]|uniref:Uncharacterized protein n=1 Tax=Heracleum sosnowskyi TaxID=360622 RepID=A0AAD8GZB8_9APIA|nr:hypothetical protein POM88_051343 [Heracleum sosnowskyi]
MSRFIDLVETFDFTSLEYSSYGKKIEGLLKRFPKYENDDRFRTVLPHKSIRTVDDYISMKFCTNGRYPIYGIYRRRDLDLVGVCVQGNIMYALDNCDLHPSFVPDLNVRKLHLGIQDSHLTTRETPKYVMEFMRSAISTLSLGYMPEKKNEWCVAIVLLTGMTTQAVRFRKMKSHVADGLHIVTNYEARHQLDNVFLGMQKRWNKFSKAIRREEYPFVYSIYLNYGYYIPSCTGQYMAGKQVSLISDKSKTKREIFKRRTNRWNGPLGNSKRKRKEQCKRALVMEGYGMKQKIDKKLSERMHGFWYGPVDTLRYEFASVYHFPMLDQMVRAYTNVVFATPPLGLLQDVFQIQKTIASIHLEVNNIWNEGGLLAFYRAVEAAHGAIADCMQPVSSAVALHKVSTSMKDFCFDFGILKEKRNLDKVKWNQEPSFVQLGCGRNSGALGATCAYPMQPRMQVQNRKAKYILYSGLSDFCRRSFLRQHEGLRGFCMTALKIWAKGLQIKK